MSELDSPVDSGKAMRDVAEQAYDELAERDGIDEHGDAVPLDDDEPLLDEQESEEVGDEDDSPIDIAADVEERQKPAQAQQPQNSSPLIPPTTWPGEWKEGFNKIPDEFKPYILDMNQKMNAGFTNKMMELSNKIRETDSVSKSVTPHMERLSRAGITPEVAVQRSLAWDAHIQRNPAQGIQDMAKAYGVDLAQVTKPADNEQYLTPTERALQDQLKQVSQMTQQQQHQWRQWQESQQQAEYNHRVGNAHRMLDQFMNATDEQGNRLHPYIEHVAGDMTFLIESGRAQNLEQAYSMAERMNDDVQAARERQRQTQNAKANQRKVQKVRRASGGIVGKTTGGSKQPRSTEQQVAAAYNKIANA